VKKLSEENNKLKKSSTVKRERFTVNAEVVDAVDETADSVSTGEVVESRVKGHVLDMSGAVCTHDHLKDSPAESPVRPGDIQ
jgi:hypothetical protein